MIPYEQTGKMYVYLCIDKKVYRHENVPGFWQNWEVVADCTSVEAARAALRLANVGVLPTYSFWDNLETSLKKSPYFEMWATKNNITTINTVVALQFLEYEKVRHQQEEEDRKHFDDDDD